MASAIVVADAFASPTWPATSSADPFAEDRRPAELVMRSCEDVSTVEYVRSTEDAFVIWDESDPTWLASSPMWPSTSALSA